MNKKDEEITTQDRKMDLEEGKDMEDGLDEEEHLDDEDDLDDELYDDDEEDEPLVLEVGGDEESSSKRRDDSVRIDKIDWDDALSVDIQEIDELQKKMFALFNALIDCKEQGQCSKDSSAMVAELTEFSRYYFGKEEEFLRRCGYPEADVHSKEHRQFIKSTISIRRQVAEDKKNLSYEVIKTLRDWLVVHITKNDHMYVPFVRVNRYIEESRQRK